MDRHEFNFSDIFHVKEVLTYLRFRNNGLVNNDVYKEYEILLDSSSVFLCEHESNFMSTAFMRYK